MVSPPPLTMATPLSDTCTLVGGLSDQVSGDCRGIVGRMSGPCRVDAMCVFFRNASHKHVFRPLCDPPGPSVTGFGPPP